MLIVDTLIVILALLLGIRKGGMAICFTCGAALTFMVFVCGLRPTSPPHCRDADYLVSYVTRWCSPVLWRA